MNLRIIKCYEYIMAYTCLLPRSDQVIFHLFFSFQNIYMLKNKQSIKQLLLYIMKLKQEISKKKVFRNHFLKHFLDTERCSSFGPDQGMES